MQYACHCDVDQRFATGGQDLVVFAQAATLRQLHKCPLDHAFELGDPRVGLTRCGRPCLEKCWGHLQQIGYTLSIVRRTWGALQSIAPQQFVD
jgi:hypothetical protein